MNKEKQINEIAQRALRKVDGCVYLILAHGDDKREYAVRCTEIPLTYVLLESGSILSDKKIYSIDKKTQRAVDKFLAYKKIKYKSNLLQRIFGQKLK